MKIVPEIVSRQIIASLPSSATAKSAAQLMIERHISSILVIDDGVLVGIATERDMTRYFAAENRDAAVVTLGEIMTRSPDVLDPDDDARDALELMELKKYRHLPVVSDGKVIGVVSIRDLYAAVKSQIARIAELSQRYIAGDRYNAE